MIFSHRIAQRLMKFKVSLFPTFSRTYKHQALKLDGVTDNSSLKPNFFYYNNICISSLYGSAITFRNRLIITAFALHRWCHLSDHQSWCDPKYQCCYRPVWSVPFDHRIPWHPRSLFPLSRCIYQSQSSPPKNRSKCILKCQKSSLFRCSGMFYVAAVFRQWSLTYRHRTQVLFSRQTRE